MSTLVTYFSAEAGRTKKVAASVDAKLVHSAQEL